MDSKRSAVLIFNKNSAVMAIRVSEMFVSLAATQLHVI
jgi:hypothetical protein